TAARHLGEEIQFAPGGRIVKRARDVLSGARELLREVEREGMFNAIARGAFGDIKRPIDGGKGAGGVFARAAEGRYINPILDALEQAPAVAGRPALREVK